LHLRIELTFYKLLDFTDY